MTWLTSLLGRAHDQPRRPVRSPRRARLRLEELESRLAPATIQWVNRGVAVDRDVNGDGLFREQEDLLVLCHRLIVG